jgi:hypothetical protein
MKRTLIFLFILSIGSVLFAQQKIALVIGNSRYTSISVLNNPENDANDMEAALRSLGFTVIKVLNGSRAQMETAMVNFKQRLGASANTYGFFFYAGHGIQSNGENYLIPVDANIPSENALRERAVSLQWVLAELNDAGNELNIVVLDSCRDNPFSWSRSGTRGLTVVSRAPPGSIVFYATSDGRQAADGTGRNGLFTSNLLNSLRTPDLEVTEVIRQTGAAVLQASGGTQVPATYNQFFGTAYLGSRPTTPTPAPSPTPAPTPSPTPAPAVVPQNSNNVIPLNVGWRTEVAGGNNAVRNGTTANMNTGREVIQGIEREVMTLTVNLARGNAWRLGQFLFENEAALQRIRTATGIRFKVLGDGGTGWKVCVPTREALSDNAFFEVGFSSRNGTVVNVDIPFSRLRQPSWGNRVSFNRNNIIGIVIQRNAGDNEPLSGTSAIKIFDFEFY